MTQETIFTEEELAQIKSIQTRYSEAGVQLVQLKLAKKNALDYLNSLTEQEEAITRELVEANESEKQLAEYFSTKYGVGSLDMETGVFVPTQE